MTRKDTRRVWTKRDDDLMRERAPEAGYAAPISFVMSSNASTAGDTVRVW